MGASHFLPIVAGPETAHRLLFSGGIVGGAEAKEMRLVSQVEETGEEALDAALELARLMANAAPLAVGTCVSTLRAQQNVGLEAALLREASSQAACYASAGEWDSYGCAVRVCVAMCMQHSPSCTPTPPHLPSYTPTPPPSPSCTPHLTST